MPRKMPRKKTLQAKVETFGLKMPQIVLLRTTFPKVKPAVLLRSYAKFMLTAESREESKWRKFAKEVLRHQYPDAEIEMEKVKYITFNLPGGSYTPDFTYLMDDGAYINVEVKGSVFQPNYRDARSKIRMASTLNPEQVFAEVMPAKEAPNGWSFEVIEPDKDYGEFLMRLAAYAEDAGDEDVK